MQAHNFHKQTIWFSYAREREDYVEKKEKKKTTNSCKKIEITSTSARIFSNRRKNEPCARCQTKGKTVAVAKFVNGLSACFCKRRALDAQICVTNVVKDSVYKKKKKAQWKNDCVVAHTCRHRQTMHNHRYTGKAMYLVSVMPIYEFVFMFIQKLSYMNVNSSKIFSFFTFILDAFSRSCVFTSLWFCFLHCCCCCSRRRRRRRRRYRERNR